MKIPSAVLPHDRRFEDIFPHCGETPGHDVEIDARLAAKHSFKHVFQPVARLEDGPM